MRSSAGRTFHVRHARMRNERRYVTVLLPLGILVIALLLDDLVDLVNCLLTGKALLSLKTKLLTAL